METRGERLRPAGCFRRPGENSNALVSDTLNGVFAIEKHKCSAGRRTQQASGLRSPFLMHRSSRRLRRCGLEFEVMGFGLSITLNLGFGLGDLLIQPF